MNVACTMNVSQLDELRAVKAILGDEVSVFLDDTLVDDLDDFEQSNDHGCQKVTVFIVADLEVSGVSIHLERAGEPVGKCGTVQHLPPVQLRATYDPSVYLSDAPNPTEKGIVLSLSSCWMIGKAASIKAQLEEVLVNLVEAVDPSEPIIYIACEEVRQQLEKLHELVYDVDDASKMHRFLLAFNIRRRNELFKYQSHECGVCFDVKDGTRFFRFECGHAFCVECSRALVISSINACDVHVKCPDTTCRELLQPHEIKDIVGNDQIFDTWTELSFKHAIACDPEFTHCPRCGGVAIEDDEENCADCGVCFWVFCTLCHDSRHPGVECVSAETKLEMLRAKAAGGSAQAVAALRKKEQEFKSLSLIEKTTKVCPSCGQGVERSQGCNKMTCICGQMFCFRCGKPVRGYEHFKEGGSCILFDEVC